MASFNIGLAPQHLMQAINPWTFLNQGAQVGLVNISLGASSQPETERAILDEVGSYGRQLGRIGDALEVLVNHFDRAGLDAHERDALTVLLGQLAQIRGIKHREQPRGEPAAAG